MMDTRDRMVEVGNNQRKFGKDFDDGKSLLHSYISEEEIWACTSCNACVEECPINIDPLSDHNRLKKIFGNGRIKDANRINRDVDKYRKQWCSMAIFTERPLKLGK